MIDQHLSKTVSAARIAQSADSAGRSRRPSCSSGVELNVISKETLADVLALALKRTGRSVKASTKPADHLPLASFQEMSNTNERDD